MSSIEKLSCREKMKEELSLTKKSYNSVWGLSLSADFPPCPPSTVVVATTFPGSAMPSGSARNDGKEKKELKSSLQQAGKKTDLISSYSDKNIEMGRDGKRVRHVCFLLLTELFVMREWGGRGWESGDKWLQCVWGAAVTQEAAQPNFFHSCTAGSENLICKLPKARQEALISAPKPLTAKKTTSK